MLIAARHLGYLARNALILSAPSAICAIPLRWPFGPGNVPLSTDVPAPAIFWIRVLHDWFVEDEIIGGVQHERRHLYLRGIDRRDLVGFAEVEKVIGIRDDSASSRRLIEEGFDLELFVNALAGSLPSSAGAVPKVLRAHSQLLACRVTILSAALRPSLAAPCLVVAVIPFRIEPDGLRPRV